MFEIDYNGKTYKVDRCENYPYFVYSNQDVYCHYMNEEIEDYAVIADFCNFNKGD